jgi:indolepyruvate ferredoxin oxidoreductase beta subunit
MSRSAFEDAIRAAGKGAEASLKGFALGFAAVTERGTASAQAPRAGLSRRPVPASFQTALAAVSQRIPASIRALIEEGFLRLADYQNVEYANRYVDRVERVLKAEQGDERYAATAAYARFLALWMSYEDVIRVADLKTRRARFERIRAEAGAQPEDLVTVTEFLKPGIEEWCSVLPRGFAARLRRRAERRGNGSAREMYVKTTSISGFLMQRALAGLKWWRPRTARFAEEQELIERWTVAIVAAMPASRELAFELAQCGRLIKGYSDTHARGKSNFLRILDSVLIEPSIKSEAERAKAVREARESALADPEGRKLEQSLTRHGIAPLPPKPKPIVWHRPRSGKGDKERRAV